MNKTTGDNENARSRDALHLKVRMFVVLDSRGYQVDFFSYFSMETYVVGTHKKHLSEVLLLSTHNIRLCGKLRKISVIFHQKRCLI